MISYYSKSDAPLHFIVKKALHKIKQKITFLVKPASLWFSTGQFSVRIIWHTSKKTRKLSGSHLCEAHSAAHGGVDGHAVTTLVSLHVQRVVLQRAGQENISSQHNKQTAKEHLHLHPKSSSGGSLWIWLMFWSMLLREVRFWLGQSSSCASRLTLISNDLCASYLAVRGGRVFRLILYTEINVTPGRMAPHSPVTTSLDVTARVQWNW